MFFAGKTREAEGDVGVHQFYSGSASESAKVEETEEIAQFTVSEIIGFLNEFETPPFVFERMFQQSKMYYFDNSEMKKIARAVTPFTQENRSKIEGFIGEFLIELAAFEAEEASEAEQKSEPEKSPPQKQQPAKEEPDTDTQIQIVKNIQTELNRLNCNAGVADGVIGNKTKSALARYATAVGKFIDEGMLNNQGFLTELQTSEIKCDPGKKDLICEGKSARWGTNLRRPIKKIIVHDIPSMPIPSSRYKLKICYLDGYCETSNYSSLSKLLDYYSRDYSNELTVSFYERNRPFEDLSFIFFPNRQSNQLLIEWQEKDGKGWTKWNSYRSGYLDKCTLSSNTTNTTTQKTHTTNPKSLASSYKYETCARVSNKRECTTGNIKLQRLKDGEYEFEEKTNSREVFYGAIKVKGSEVELQMVDFIEGVAVSINGTGTLNKNNNEIVFAFSDEHVIKTFGKAGIDLKNGDITDLIIRRF